MKTLLFLLLPIASFAQPSISVGLNSRIHATGQIAYEVDLWPVNIEVSAKSTTETPKPTLGLQLGFASDGYCDRRQFRVAVGGYYHFDKIIVGKPDGPKFRVGGSVRWMVNGGTFGVLYDGQTIGLSVGYIFKKRSYTKYWRG